MGREARAKEVRRRMRALRQLMEPVLTQMGVSLCGSCAFNDPAAITDDPELLEKIRAAMTRGGRFVCHAGFPQDASGNYCPTLEQQARAPLCAGYAALRKLFTEHREKRFVRCEARYGPGNVRIGYTCGAGRRGGAPRLKPCACGRPSAYECDGPAAGNSPPPRSKKGTGAAPPTCDRPICTDCAVSIRAFDLDFCPSCASAAPPAGCLLTSSGPELAGARCRGVLVGHLDLCVRHAVLFDHWLAFAGGSKVYATPEMDREQKRQLHRDWLAQLAAEEATRILGARHAPA